MEERNIREAIWANYDEIQKEIKSIGGNDDTYQIKLEERDKIRNELLKLEQLRKEREIAGKAAKIV